LLKKTSNAVSTRNKDHLLRTTPNININNTPNINRKSNDYRPPVRPINSSHQIPNKPMKASEGFSYQKKNNAKSDT
jgi:hypothetical protein